MQTRYGKVTSRDSGKPEPHTIVRYDQEVQEKYDGLLQKTSELSARLHAGFNKQDDLVKQMGLAIAAGEDWVKIAKELTGLRLEEEALEAGILYLKGQTGLMKRLHHWIK